MADTKEQLEMMENNTEKEQQSRAEFLEKMKALKTSVAEMVTNVAATNANETNPTVDSTFENVEKEKKRYDGFEDASTGRRTIVDTDMDRETYREKGWDRVFMTYDEVEAMKWMNAQQPITPKSMPIDSTSTNDEASAEPKSKSTHDEASTRVSDDEPYKDHDPRSKNYNGQLDRRGARQKQHPHPKRLQHNVARKRTILTIKRTYRISTTRAIKTMIIKDAKMRIWTTYSNKSNKDGMTPNWKLKKR
jgi:hypothetical protein